MKYNNFYLFFLVALMTVGCTRQAAEKSSLKIKLPGYSQNSNKILGDGSSGSIVSQTLSQTYWSLSAPTNAAAIKCYAVVLSGSGLNDTLTCKNAALTTVLTGHKLYGLFPAGADLELTVPTGVSRTITLIGFNASSVSACANSLGGIDKSQFSAPAIVGSKTVDVNANMPPVEITASMTGAVTFDACDGTEGFTGGTATVPTLSFSGSSSTQSEGVSTFNFPVVLSATASYPVVVNYAVTGSATASADYTISTGNTVGSITINSGTTGNIVANIVDDANVESSESLTVAITSVTNATVGSPNSYTLNITDNDTVNPTVNFSTSSQSFAENNGTANLPINLSVAAPSNILVTYTVSGTASAGTDHNFVDGSFIISSGATSGNIAIPITNDTMYEASETLAVTITNVTNATLGSPTTHTLTITNDDAQPSVTLTNTALTDNEGDAIVVGALLDTPSGIDVTVPINVGPANGSHFNKLDFKLIAATITIFAGNTSGTTTLNIVDDNAIEKTEDYQISLGAPSGATLGGATSIIRTVSASDHNSLGLWASTPMSSTLAPSAAYLATAVWTGSRVLQWGGHGISSAMNTGAAYNPSVDTWTAITTTSAPVARSNHSAVWTGSRMIIWGGVNTTPVVVNSGGVYDLSTDAWTSTMTSGAPSARADHSAIWTGKEMIIWGGTADWTSTFYNDGAKYNPVGNSWATISSSGAPVARFGHAAYWTGQRMIIWGGTDNSSYFGDGGLYNPATNTWSSITGSNAPTGRAFASTVWTGQKMIVWGGRTAAGTVTNIGKIYDPQTNIWTNMTTVNAPAARDGAKAVWTGTHFVVWGGTDSASTPYNNGGIYDPISDAWASLSSSNLPAARDAHNFVWTGNKIYLFGGRDGGGTALGYSASKMFDMSLASSRVRQLVSGMNHNCVLLDSGLVKCWGFNNYGNLGQASTTTIGDDPGEVAAMSPISLPARAVQISSGDQHVCALLENQSVICWGNNSEGNLGISNFINIGDNETPTATVSFSGFAGNPIKVAAGGHSTCAISETGVAQCWGYNSEGQLGDATLVNRSAPVALSGAPPLVDLSLGTNHVIARATDGTTLSWGGGAYGQLGLGTTTNHNVYQTIASFFSSLFSAGSLFSCGLNSDTLYCWGLNTYGHLADGTNTNRNVPTITWSASPNTVSALSAGGNHGCAIISGWLNCWGYNGDGQVGVNTTTSYSTPMNVVGGMGITQVATGGAHTCAVYEDGGVRCWGDNAYGQLGTGEPVIGLGRSAGQMENLKPVEF